MNPSVPLDAAHPRRPDPIRVLHVLFRLQAGGTEYGVIKVANGLVPAGIESAICSTTPADEVRRLLHPQVGLVECRRRAGNDPSLVWQLAREFRRLRPHIVHTHAWGTLVEGVLAARLARVPVVIHGEHGTLQLRPYQARVQRFMWGRVDRLLSVSSRLAERMSAATGFPLERIQVIRNGVDLGRFQGGDRAAARAALGLGDGEVAVGTAGRLVPVKDQQQLVRALGTLVRAGAPAAGLIAGEGPLRQDLEQLIAAEGVQGRVRLLGHRPDIERVLAALDVFVLPSLSEGLSNTILEAMASGVPVVATRVGGADELVVDGETGVLVTPGSLDALTGAIDGLVRDAGRREAMAAAGRRRALGTFGLSRMLQDYAALYRGLCGARGAGAPAGLAVEEGVTR
jgi:sugar transferase (PEP-CTERM/EpsH1 system associated)